MVALLIAEGDTILLNQIEYLTVVQKGIREVVLIPNNIAHLIKYIKQIGF